jgi:hypothetical protein
MYDTPMIFYDFSAFHSLACLQWTCIAHQPSAYNVQALRCIHTSEPVFGFSSCLGTSALKKCGNNFDVLSTGMDKSKCLSRKVGGELGLLQLHILIVCDVLGRYVKESLEYRSYCQRYTSSKMR